MEGADTLMSLWALFWVFAYVGLLTIGGGLVAIPIMQQEIIAKRGLISLHEFINMIAVSESTPGPMGINMATYIGYKLHGIFGALMTSIGTVFPSVIIALTIAIYFSRFQDKPLVKACFKGLRPAVTGMIGVAAAQIFIYSLLNTETFGLTHRLCDLFYWKNAVFYLLAVFGLFKLKMHPVLAIVFGAVFGILFL